MVVDGDKVVITWDKRLVDTFQTTALFSDGRCYGDPAPGLKSECFDVSSDHVRDILPLDGSQGEHESHMELQEHILRPLKNAHVGIYGNL